jgi:hypothetical protein
MRPLIVLCLLLCQGAAAAQDDGASLPAIDVDAPQLRFIRAYGSDNEVRPPIVLLKEADDPSIVGSAFATVEFDISASTIPNVYATLVHCKADWSEDDNAFLSSVMNRTSLIDWRVAPQRSTYYQYRGLLRLPNAQIDLRFSGNWKVKVWAMDDDRLLGETRIFVVDPQALCRFNFMTDFYEPKARVSSIALTLEAIIDAPSSDLFDSFMHTTVFYRNHRWNEPFIVSNKYREDKNPYGVGTAVRGVFPTAKIFRLSRIPAQNEYRVMDLSNLAMYPSTGQPVRMPLSDQRRNGMFLDRSDDGAMTTRAISSAYDEYVPLEFILDPAPGYPSDHDVFVVGSFNNWKASRQWMMYYDESLRRYRLRQWVRRGRHNYMYATGRLNVDDGTVDDLSYEEWEGNTASNSNSYIAFTYYTVQEYGGYDAIVAVGASNIYSSGR